MKNPVNLKGVYKVYRRLSSLQRWVYPGICTLCDAPGIDDLDLCRGCLHDLPKNHHACLKCALPLPANPATSSVCGACLHPAHRPACDQVWAGFIYTGPMPWLVTQLKFHQRLPHARLFAELMWLQLARPLEHQPDALPDMMMPVPLHPQRFRERGFNQAVEIARPLAGRCGIRLDFSGLRRIKATERQSDLNQSDRRRNLKDAFECKSNVRNKHIVLVDDVMTSGSTIEAAAKTLKQSGAARVSAWVTARAALHTI